MSFKREGDDRSQLGVLKRRRVADLLSRFIPEDEAALLKNGRYTCLVCARRPVFDTVDVLSVHRRGKRHLEGLKWFYGKKTQTKNEVTKRQHQNYVKAEDGRQEPSSSAPLLAQTQKLKHHALLKTLPYDSCHRKTSTKCEKRLSCGSALNGSSSPEEKTALGGTTEATETPSDKCDSKASRRKKGSRSQESEPLTAERRRELEHYVKLKSDGWLQDRSGQWVKDENAEFDSDEDQPPPPPPAALRPGDGAD